jgi:DNA-binding transcriptional regulator GbsR (MarR family)
MEDIKQKVEDLGVFLEKFGRTPIEGRVFAYLLLTDPPHSTFDELVEFLKASKGAISKALNTFQKEGTVSYKTFSGDRKRYFYVNTKGWHDRLIESARNLSAFNVVLDDVLRYRKSSKDEAFNQEIQLLKEFQEFISNRLEKAIVDWRNKQ